MGKLATLGADSMDVTDIYESEGYKVLRDFYERLPIAITTKQVLDQRAAILEKLAAADSLAKQEEIIARLLKDEKELLDADPVYVRVEDYIQKIAAANLQDADSLEEQVKEDEGAEKKDDTGSEKTIGPEVTGYYDTLVNQRGDVVFLDSRARQQTPNYITALYAKDWTHVGLYAGSSMVYDSHPAPCGGRNHGGVGLRPANAHFFRSGSRVMLAQLSTSSKRWTEGRALDQAQASTRFGDDCRKPFSFNFLESKFSTNSFYCSKLVWRVYWDNRHYPRNIDSNSSRYLYWLITSPDNGRVPIPWYIAYSLVLISVTPDEIAYDGDLNNYARYRYR